MIVTRILGDCPKCGAKNKFGNVSVRGNQLFRGCMDCSYRLTIPLPDIRKKILYLDQFFFSSAYRQCDKRFLEATKLIRKVSEDQLLVTPFSTIHEDETHQWRGYDDKNKEELMEFIKATSRGNRFKPYYNIERTQIGRAFDAFINGYSEIFELKESDAVDGDIHQWDNYLRIDTRGYDGDIKLIRYLKERSVEELVDQFPRWRESKNSFDEDVKFELKDAARIYVKSYRQFLSRLAGGDHNALYDSPIISMVVQELFSCLPDEINPEEGWELIKQFFETSHFKEVPYCRISATIYAKLRHMVRRGSYGNSDNAIKRLSGFFQDVKHISAYAPYSDAFVMDRPMASIVSDPNVNLGKEYNVKIFSLNNWDQFLSWLNKLKDEMSEEHAAGLATAYP